MFGVLTFVIPYDNFKVLPNLFAPYALGVVSVRDIHTLCRHMGVVYIGVRVCVCATIEPYCGRHTHTGLSTSCKSLTYQQCVCVCHNRALLWHTHTHTHISFC